MSFALDFPSNQIYVRDMVAGTTTLVSTLPGADTGGTDSALSTDGTLVVFAGLDNYGLMVRNVPGQSTSPQLNVLPSGQLCFAPSDSYLPSISGTGRYVAFNCSGQVFVRDRDPDGDSIFDEVGNPSVTRRIDESAAGVAGNNGSAPAFPRVSKTGRFVVFTSDATNLLGTGGDTNGQPDVFVADVDGDGDGVFYEAGDRRVWRASVASDGTPQSDASPSFLRVADISDDGRITAFNSVATNLVAADTNDLTDIFVYDHYAWRVADLFTPTTETMTPRISGNGMWTAFASEATTLVTGDSNNLSDVFVRDRRKAMGTAGSVVRVSVATNGTQAIGGVSDQPSISHDGRFIVFRSDRHQPRGGRHERRWRTSSSTTATWTATGSSTRPARARRIASAWRPAACRRREAPAKRRTSAPTAASSSSRRSPPISPAP